jgi:hypothetical protein
LIILDYRAQKPVPSASFGWPSRPASGKGTPHMHRFRSPMISLALSALLTLLTAAAALAEGQPPQPR